MRVWQILNLGSMLVAATLAVSGCEKIKRVENRGYVKTASTTDSLIAGVSTRKDVAYLLGSPSTVSDFPPETWYYISRESETVAFWAPELKDQSVLKIEFDAEGKVAAVHNFGKEASREVAYSDRKTSTEGRELGLGEQLLGNIGRFNSPRDSTESRQ